MSLSNKMFDRSMRRSPVSRERRGSPESRHVDGLFDKDWEVFVIKRDHENGKYDWFTMCCELAGLRSVCRQN